LPRGEAYLGFGQPDRNRLQEVPIILDINRAKNAEYAVGDGIFNNIEHQLKKYNIKKPEVTKENKFSLIAIESLVKILNDSTLIDHHQTVLRGICFIVLHIGNDSIQFLPLIIPSILNGIMNETETNSQYLKNFHDCLQTIIDCVP
jgi:hypothetical protein